RGAAARRGARRPGADDLRQVSLLMMITITELQSERLILRALGADDAPAVLEYHRRCWPSVAPWMPLVEPQFFTVEAHRARLESERTSRLVGSAVRFYLFRQSDPAGPIIGDLNFSSIIRGAFQSCFVGYKMDGAAAGQGYMTEALRRGAEFALTELRLHRLEANIIPRNLPSRRVAAKAGFVEEGLSHKYLRINGVWEDHLHYVLLNNDYDDDPSAGTGRFTLGARLTIDNSSNDS
ncbi:GNAT family N-acetyltransferase, partial [Oscillochloris sp. ZM17-4]|uniref:GNAT family N-acetyltransferase n=1 Tax=Oscillochloris sp. ZM17-4 TaxID=2866714 RepID=UPI001C73C3B0